MSNQGQWAISRVDVQAHVLVAEGNHPPGVLKAQCGALLPVTAVRTTARPTLVLTCPACAEILIALFSGRPPLPPSVATPGGRPVPVPLSQRGPQAPAGRRLSDAPGSAPDGQSAPQREDDGLSDNN